MIFDDNEEKLLKNGISPDVNHPDLEGGKKRILDETSLIEGIFKWVSNIGEIFGNLLKGGIDIFKNK